MADIIRISLAIWQTIIFIIAIVITINAGIQYRKKKTTVAKHLYIAFIIITFAALFQCTPTIRSAIPSLAAFPFESGIWWIDQFFIEQWSQYQFGYYFLALGVYFLYLFSLDLIFEEGTKKGARIIPSMFIVLIVVYGMFIKYQIPVATDDFVGNLLAGIDLWIGLYIIILMIPLIVDSSRVLKALEKGDSMRTRFISLIIFASSLLVTIINFVIETVVGNSPNAFSFIAWAFAVSALVFAYMGLYRKK